MNPKNHHFLRIATLVIILLMGALSLNAQLTSFTSEDALNVKSFRISDITNNGDFLAGTISTGRDRLNVDHSRYGDPNYVSPRASQLVILDVKKQVFLPVTQDKVISRGMKWSPDNQTLAMVLYKEKVFKLFLYDLKKKKSKELDIKSDKELASNTLLEWTPDGNNIIMSFREDGLKEKGLFLYPQGIYISSPVFSLQYQSSNILFLSWQEYFFHRETI